MKFFDALNFAPRPKVEMSTFDMSHEHKTSLAFGKIAPVFLQEVLPGDKWHISPNAFLRTMPLLSPMMHKLDLKMRFFFVPNRLIWTGWEKFISRGFTGEHEDEFVPTFSFSTNGSISSSDDGVLSKGSLLDYFGFPLSSVKEKMRISQLPFRAYDLVICEYFRNNLIDIDGVLLNEQGAARYDVLNGIFSVNDDVYKTTRFRLPSLLQPADLCWENDYFTSASTTPLGQEVGPSSNMPSYAGNTPVADHLLEGAQVSPDGSFKLDGNFLSGNFKNTDGNPAGVTVNELRTALRLQNFLETGLRYGRRYVEQLFGHFGVESSDARLQRPEYLGGGSLAVQVSEVASTAGSDAGHLGDLAGRGLSVGSFGDINFTSEEHGFIIGVAYLSPHSSYYGGIPRTFLRSERLDFAFPEFADLGAQPIWQSELDASDNYNDDATNHIFGYVPRYSDYKQALDRFSGDMVRDLAFWHLGRDFSGTSPALNADFVYINDKARESLNRVFGVTDAKRHPFVCTFGFTANALRPLPFNPQTIF